MRQSQYRVILNDKIHARANSCEGSRENEEDICCLHSALLFGGTCPSPYRYVSRSPRSGLHYRTDSEGWGGAHDCLAILPRDRIRPALLLGSRLMDKPEPTERQKFDAVMYQQADPRPEIAQKEKHEFRAFWVLGAPLGLVAAFALTVATNMGTPAFFIAWLVFAVIIGGFFSSMSGAKGSSK